MATLEERLREVMEAMRWEHADVMRVSRQSSSVVSQWLGKGTKTIQTIGKLEAALYLERESGFSALWIAKGIGPKRVVQRPSEAAAWPLAPYVSASEWDSMPESDRHVVAHKAREAIDALVRQRDNNQPTVFSRKRPAAQ